MTPLEQYRQAITRRHFFGQAGLGLGTAALASLLPPTEAEASATGIVRGHHFAPKPSGPFTCSWRVRHVKWICLTTSR